MAIEGLRDFSLIATRAGTSPRHQDLRLGVSDRRRSARRCCANCARRPGVFPAQRSGHHRHAPSEKLAELVPEARIAHRPRPDAANASWKRVMADFHRQRFNVLVCTTIIETGIDIPTANTIIIHRADRFGLAQLHQLRGRVGRSHIGLRLSDRARRRGDDRRCEEAPGSDPASMEELGSGFYLATHDLEIRGAGEVLGDEQSGQIQEIGFGLYTRDARARRARAEVRQGPISTSSRTRDRNQAAPAGADPRRPTSATCMRA